MTTREFEKSLKSHSIRQITTQKVRNSPRQPNGKRTFKKPSQLQKWEKTGKHNIERQGNATFSSKYLVITFIIAGLFCRDGAVVSEHSPPRMWPVLRFPDPRSNVGRFCWFSTLLREVFLSLKNNMI